MAQCSRCRLECEEAELQEVVGQRLCAAEYRQCPVKQNLLIRGRFTAPKI